MRVSILIPFYNEEKTILPLLKKILAIDLTSLALEKEIILINDGSTDNGHEIIASFLKNADKTVLYYHHSVNQGKGAALRTGFSYATGVILLIQDADLEYDPQEYPKLLLPIINGEAAVVYGSRFLSEENLRGERNMYFMHYLGNKLLTFITNLLYNANLSDMETGYKVFRKDVLHDIVLTASRFDIEPELTAKILRKNIQILSVPISFNARSFKDGKKITWKDGLIAFWWLVKCRFSK